MSTDNKTLSNKAKAMAEKHFDPTTLALGKIVLGLGIAGFILWISPWTLETLMTIMMPLMIVFALIAGIIYAGQGGVELFNAERISKQLYKYLQEATKAEEAKPTPVVAQAAPAQPSSNPGTWGDDL